ncbi:RHS repeat domain-containing protein [Planctomycetota bacterium]
MTREFKRIRRTTLNAPRLTLTTYDSEEVFGLDGVGNRISVTHGSSINYTTNDLNQYEQIGSSSTLDYDDNGNLISGTANTHIYDYANRLLKVTRTSDDQILAEYKYDALGRRYWKKAWNGSSFVETYFYYDGPRCIEERNASDVMIAQYVFGNGIDEVLTMERNSETYYYHENSLGSIYAVTTATGTVAERYSYDAYGNVSFYDGAGNPIGGTAIGNRILYTGREYDAETGLYDYRERTYSAELGRFLQRDPAEDDLLLNLYAYVGNNPVNYVDPMGLWGGRELTGDEKNTVQKAVTLIEMMGKATQFNFLQRELDEGDIEVDEEFKGTDKMAMYLFMSIGPIPLKWLGQWLYVNPDLVTSDKPEDIVRLAITLFHEAIHHGCGGEEEAYDADMGFAAALRDKMKKGEILAEASDDVKEAIYNRIEEELNSSRESKTIYASLGVSSYAPAAKLDPLTPSHLITSTEKVSGKKVVKGAAITRHIPVSIR